MFPDDLDGIVLLISDFDDERTGTLWAAIFLLLRVDLVFASSLASIGTPREEVADVKAPDFENELDFVPPTGRTLAEVLAVLPAACLLTAPPVLLLLSEVAEVMLVDDLIIATLGRALGGFEDIFSSAAPGKFTLAVAESFTLTWGLCLAPTPPWLVETGILILD